MHAVSETINIVAQSDERFVQHLVSMLTSLAQNNQTCKPNVFLFVPSDCRDFIWTRVRQLVPRLNLELIAIDGKLMHGLTPPMFHLRPTAYSKFYIGDLLPSDISKALYLDSDMVVRADLGELLCQDLGTCIVGATPDQWVVGPQGFRIKQRLGLAPNAPYFNAGVLLIDVRRWREADVGADALQFAKDHSDRLTFADQCALNWVLREKWKPLSEFWNVQTASVTSLTWGFMNYTKKQKNRAARAKVIHFTGSSKPWHYMSKHPLKHEYFAYLRSIGLKPAPAADFTTRNFIRKNVYRFLPFAMWLRYWLKQKLTELVKGSRANITS